MMKRPYPWTPQPAPGPGRSGAGASPVDRLGSLSRLARLTRLGRLALLGLISAAATIAASGVSAAAWAQEVVPAPVGDPFVAVASGSSPDGYVDHYSGRFAPGEDGGFLMLWFRHGGVQGVAADLLSQRFDSRDRPLGTRVQVSDPAPAAAHWQGNLEVAAHEDRVVAVWHRTAGTTTTVLARFLDRQGRTTSRQVRIGSAYTSLYDPTVALAPSGVALVAWEPKEEDGREVSAVLLSRHGTFLTGELTLTERSSGYQRRVSAGADGSGRFLVVWQHFRPGQGARVLGRWVDPAGRLLGPPFEIGESVAGRPKLAVAEDGGAVVTWTDCTADDPELSCQVRMRLLGTGGQPLGGEIRVSPEDGRINQRPAVALSDDGRNGRIAVTWESCLTTHGTDRYDCRVETAFFDPDGAMYGAPLEVPPDGQPVDLSVVALEPQGSQGSLEPQGSFESGPEEFLVGWYRFNCDDQSCDHPGPEGVYAQRYRLETVEEPPPAPPSPPDGVEPLTTPELPGFRVWVRIGGADGGAAGRLEPDCIPETLCVSGALPGRSEVFVRVPGPKPNGRLWPTIVKFTTSEVEVWIEQIGSGEIRSYRLEGASPGSSELPGLFDRDGFLP